MKKLFTLLTVFVASIASAFAAYEPEYNDLGEATVPFSALKSDGGITLTPGEDGAIVVTDDGKGGSFWIDFPEEGVNMSQGFTVTSSGDDIVDHAEFASASNGSLGGLWGSKFGFNIPGSDRDGKCGDLNILKWVCKAEEGTLTIKSIVLKKIVSLNFNLKPYETELTKDMMHDWTSVLNPVDKGSNGTQYNTYKELKPGDMIWGWWDVFGQYYADLVGYKELRVYATPGTKIRFLFNRPVDGTSGDIVSEIIDVNADGVAVLDLTKYDYVHLNAIKVPSDWQGGVATIVKGIALYKDPVLSETAEANDIQLCNGIDLKVTRKIIVGKNTVCFPFALSAAQVAEVFGAGSKVYAFDSADTEKVYFKEVDAMKAGVPYIVDATEAKSEFNVTADITAKEPTGVEENGVTFQGTFNVAELSTDGSNLFLATDGKIKKPVSTENNANKLKGMRAYFVVNNGASVTAFSISFGGETTGINAVEGTQSVKAQGVYNLQGVKVAETTGNLAKGLYIVNGKKFIQK